MAQALRLSNDISSYYKVKFPGRKIPKRYKNLKREISSTKKALSILRKHI